MELTGGAVRRRDDFEDPHNPDELDDEELAAAQSPIYTGAGDADICRDADLGDPTAGHIFESWPKDRQDAAIRAVDKGEK
jgi:hypothetical protein